MNFIKRFDEINEDEIDLVGGKGLSLGRLTQAGLAVPPGFVITTEAYSEFNEKETSSAFEESVFKAFDSLGADRVAVRSSAIAEDSPDASWAGQFESYLNVGREQLIDSIKKCWQSASSEIVESYADNKSISKEELELAVVVQKMVNSEVSGVAFSVNPITKDTSEIMIEAIYGLGELLVQGMVTPDNYVIDKESSEILVRTIKPKSSMLVYKDSQNVETPVPQDKQNTSCLIDEQIAELSKLVDRIEHFYGQPQDIEWAFESNRFYIVQSRPITTI